MGFLLGFLNNLHGISLMCLAGIWMFGVWSVLCLASVLTGFGGVGGSLGNFVGCVVCSCVF